MNQEILSWTSLFMITLMRKSGLVIFASCCILEWRLFEGVDANNQWILHYQKQANLKHLRDTWKNSL